MMNERITFISLFDDVNLKKITKYTDLIDPKMCKVPFGKKVDNRMENDTLPYHFTLFPLSIKKEEEFLKFLTNFEFSKFKILIDSLELIEGAEGSYELRFHIVRNAELVELQKRIVEVFPTKTYIPGTFNFHITLDVRKDFDEISRIKGLIEEHFEPFELEVGEFGLFEIYPAKLVRRFFPFDTGE